MSTTPKPDTRDLIPEADIIRWVDRLAFVRHEDALALLLPLYDAAQAEDIATLRRLSRKGGKLITRMAQIALAAIPRMDRYTATEGPRLALNRLFQTSPLYSAAFDVFLTAQRTLPPVAPKAKRRAASDIDPAEIERALSEIERLSGSEPHE